MQIAKKLGVFFLIPMILKYCIAGNITGQNGLGLPAAVISDSRTKDICPDEETLTSAVYTDSGNENGNLYEARLCQTQNGDTVLEVYKRDAAWETMVHSIYRAGNGVLDSIAETVKYSEFREWKQDKHEYMEVCDASQPYLYLIYTDEEGNTRYTSINGYTLFTDAESKVYRDCVKLITQWEKEENLILREDVNMER